MLSARPSCRIPGLLTCLVAILGLAGGCGSAVDLGTAGAPGASVPAASDIASTPAIAPVCLADGDCAALASGPCQRALCEPKSQRCVVVTRLDGAACDDGEACTSESLCKGGTCAATRDLSCDDHNPCTQDGCALAQGCTHTALDAACSDGNPCTTDDQCVAGACVAKVNLCSCQTDADCKPFSVDACVGAMQCSGGACAPDPTQKVDCDDSNTCTVDSCNGNTGECVHDVLGDGHACDDGDVCTFGETCQGAACKAGSTVACGLGTGACPVTCDKKLGCSAPAGGGQTCDDGNSCTANDLCNQGSCVGSPSCGCQTDADCASAGVPACQGVAVCKAGACTVDASQAVPCAQQGPQCSSFVCASKGCEAVSFPDGAWCTDGNPCTLGDTCKGGTCKSASAQNCDDGNTCTTDACSLSAGCTHVDATDQQLCNDGNPCSTGDACKAGQCKGKGNLCDDADPCTSDICDPTMGGKCMHKQLQEGTPCDDGDDCTLDSTCTGGSCIAAQVLDCDDASPCTKDICLPDGCTHTALEGDVSPTCDDGDPCTIADTCAGGQCVGQPGGCECVVDADCAGLEDGNLCNGTLHCVQNACVVDVNTLVNCSPSLNPCTIHQCAPALGVCLEVPVPVDVTVTMCDDGNACTAGDQCGPGGVCVPGKAQACDDANVCTQDLCEPASGCVYPAWDATAAVPCDDGSLCTFNDTCLDGKCLSGQQVCECQADTDCAAKDDGDLCNGSLICKQGACVSDGKQVACTAPISSCLQSACDAKTGQCVTFAAPDGQNCSTGGTCTTGGTCQQGACKGAVVAGCDDGNPCTKDVCLPEGCTHTAAVGQPCDDANTCTTGEVCGATGTCGGGSNACLCATDAECTKFDDGDLCNGIWSCQGGTCQPKTGSVVACDKTKDGPCQQNVCDPKVGACGLSLQPTGTACSDADACTDGDTCSAGNCLPGKLISCDDGQPCTLDACSPITGCYYENSTKACDDGNPCTSGDACAGGKCSGSGQCQCQIDKDCADDGDLCNGIVKCMTGQCKVDPATLVICDGAANTACAVNACDPKVGKCALTPVPDGTQCDDANVCTTKDQCVQGSCKGDNFGCDDKNPCTQDSCSPTQGCVNTPLTGACDDSNPCTTGETCTQGKCAGGKDICGTCKVDSDCPNDGDLCNGVLICAGGACSTKPGSIVACAVGDACSSETCVKTTGLCQKTSVPDGQPCDDGTTCTASSSCFGGACVGSNPLNCDDKNGCTADSCDPKQGCTHVNAPGPCDDGNSCTQGDTCSPLGQCTAGPNTCQCQGDADCKAFEDGNLCNGTLICQANTCVIKAGSVITCPAGGTCTASSCDAASGICVATNLPDGATCSDGSVCTTGEVCKAGSCLGASVSCDDNNVCTADACDATTGCVHKNADGLTCDDGNKCTQGDVCKAGACASGVNQCQCTATADCAKFEDGNACNGTLICQNNGCVVDPKTVVVCPDDSLTCTVAACDAATGKCSQKAAADGQPCGGAELCGGTGACKAGLCAGPIGCPDDGNVCTTAACDGKGVCLQSSATATCDDGNACTLGDACAGGKCVGGANQCLCKLDADCAKFDDGDLCNGIQRCVAGQCQPDPTSVVVCPAASGPCSANVCQTKTGQCAVAASPNGTPCDDKDACTTAGQCFGGACLVGKVNCDDSNVCTTDGCNAATGCTHQNLGGFPPQTCDDGDVCTPISICQGGKCTGVFNNCFCQNDSQCQDDGNLCNGVPSCQNGTCKTKPGSAVVCDASKDTACLKNTCQAALGTCLLLPSAPGTLCDDGNTCTGGDVCTVGNCVGVAANCDDGIACTLDACDPKTGCTHLAQNKLCDDGNACTTDSCNVSGGCLTQPALGAPCSDGNACTSGDQCAVTGGGVTCVGQAKVLCDDKNPCTADFCDAASGCGAKPQTGGVCDDGDPCTSSDACSGGKCVGQGATCDDANPCTADSCTAGKCVHAPASGNCDDGSLCTTGDTCIGGSCIGAGKVNCDDANPCTTETCDPKKGCVYTPTSGTACSDGNPCTDKDTCNAGKCSGSAKVCDDKNPCTLDVCDAATGNCLGVPQPGSPCDDGSACTTKDTCSGSGSCAGTPSVNCDDGNACTNDACVAATGACTHTNNSAPCNDGNVCTTDICSAGACTVTPAPGTACSDGNPCTDSDVCLSDGKTCQGKAKSCDDGVACTTDACDVLSGTCSHTAPTGFSKNFDDGQISPVATQALSQQLKWQIDVTQATSLPSALYYGRIQANGAHNYNGGPSTGTANLPAVTVPATVSAPVFTAAVFYSRDPAQSPACNGLADRVAVQINGTLVKTYCASTNGFEKLSLDLTAYKGQAVNISFVFINDFNNNNGQGLWVDDLAVSWSCP